MKRSIFLEGKGILGSVRGLGPSGSPWREKKEKTKCIYKICTPSHRSKFKTFAKIRQTFFVFLFEFMQKSLFFDNFHRILHRL